MPMLTSKRWWPALADVEARRRARLTTGTEQVVAGQRYAFAYDASTIAELEAVTGCHVVGEADDE